MEITSFHPLIVTKDAEGVMAVFEELGFERRHQKTGINGSITNVSMKNAAGFAVDVTQSQRDLPRDMTLIRMNVRDFDEACAFLAERGFTNAQGDKVTETGSSKATLMVSPSGFGISVIEHIRK